jgi:integrase/recombinase XerD
MHSGYKNKEKEELLGRFEEELSYRNMTKNTAKTYIFEVMRFLRQVKKPVDTICSDDFKRYLINCVKRKLATSTIIVKRSALRLFAEKCLKLEAPEFTDARIKVKRRIKKVASIDDIKFLISCAKDLRDQTILLTLFATGMRSSELTQIKITDIDSKRMFIHVQQGKGQKDRLVPLSKGLLMALRQYYRVYRPGEWLFPNDTKTGPMPVNRIPQIWRYVKVHSGLNIVGGVHLLRHYFATHLLDDNVNLNTIRQVLGHASIRSTAHYLSYTNKAASECSQAIDKMLLNNGHNNKQA